MRLAFAGTPEFAVAALDALHGAGHEIAGVFTQPDRPAGRGRRLSDSPVARRAAALGLQVHKPERFREPAQQILHALAVERMIVVAYGLILPQAALDIPRHGCLNIHASLLPRWRGAAPIQRAIEAGDEETGITIMQMDAGLDTGPMLLSARTRITEQTTAAQLHDVLASLGARLIVQALAQLERGTLPPQPQPGGATYAAKLGKEEARIDWTQPAPTLARRVRAFNPVPVCWTEAGGERLRVWNARTGSGAGAAPGQILACDRDGVHVACGDGVLCLTELQWPGARAQAAAQAAQGRLHPGDRLG